MLFPGCSAVTVHNPPDTSVTVIPDMLQEPDAANVTSSPELALAGTVKGRSP